MRSALLLGLGVLAGGLFAIPAPAANLTTFGQTAAVNELTATVNGADTQTTFSVLNAPVTIAQLITGAPPATSFLDLSAASIDPAVTVAGAIIQHYSGSFCLTTAINCGGVNVLSGSFSDAAFGAAGGPGIVVNVNNPPDTLVLSSGLIPTADLSAPNALSLAFTNIPSPGLSIIGTTIGPFTASFAGTVSAVAASEPAMLALLGLGLLLTGVLYRRNTPG